MIRISQGPFWLMTIAAGWLGLMFVSWVEDRRPATDWYVPGEVIVEDGPRGQCNVITFNREIKAPFTGEWEAALLRQQPSGRFSIYRTYDGSAPYSPQNSLPDVVDLGWWFEINKCDYPSGVYRVYTAWTIYPETGGGAKTISKMSTSFTIY